MEKWIIMIVVFIAITILEILFTHLISYWRPAMSELKTEIFGFLAAAIIASGVIALLRFFLFT